MVTSNPEPKDVREVGSIYKNVDLITSFEQQLTFSYSDDEEKVILEACSLAERANMVIFDTYSTSSFYFYLLAIGDIEGFLSFSPFEADVFTFLNVTPTKSHLTAGS